MADEGLHEIQLNGKQLVFLFMASTVVAVVIFLCGVMVGRGVRAQRPADASEASVDAVTDPTADVVRSAEPVSPSAIPSSAPVASQETLTYPERLEGLGLPEERLRPAVTTAAPVKTITESIPREPAGNGFVVQVAAVNDRREADAIAKRLADKGYPTFVTMPPKGIPKMFRVRIGKYPTRREAETIAARLEKEDQFKPWITR
jgi:cell division septation protein DedD